MPPARIQSDVSSYMVNLLMCNPAIILQDVVILRSGSFDKFLHDRLQHPINARLLRPGERCLGAYQDFGKLVVGNVCELFAVVFWDYKLGRG